MQIRVEQGKERRDRDALLSSQLLRMLRDWWKAARFAVWLFPNRLSAFEHVTPRSLNRAFHVAAKRAGIAKPVWTCPALVDADSGLMAPLVPI